MQGVVRYFLPDRHFGFLKYSSTPRSGRLDREAYFKEEELRGWQAQAGDHVEFEVGTDATGRERAIDIYFNDDRFSGTVVTTSKKAFCFIEVDGRYGDNQRIFCAFDDVLPDVIGRRSLIVGNPVSFRIEPKRDGRGERAVDVRNEDSSIADSDAEQYREIGRVERFDGDLGHLRRPTGETLTFLRKNIITEGIETIAAGSWLQYGIKVHRYLFDEERQQFRHRVYARDIAVCIGDSESPQPILPVEYVKPNSIEAQFLAAEELPLAEPEPERLEPGRVYLASERKLSLRELIARKRAA